MNTQEIYVPEGATKTLRLPSDFTSGDSYAILAHVLKGASLIIIETLQTILPCSIRLTVRLEGEGASVVDRSRYQGLGNAVLDIERVIVHIAPGTTSRVDARGIMHDASRALWRGRVLVEQGAKRAQAFLRHDAILTGKEAYMDAAPFLEIFTDDAICKHGASVRRIQPAELFYMKSRGVLEEEARNMLLEGFLAGTSR